MVLQHSDYDHNTVNKKIATVNNNGGPSFSYSLEGDPKVHTFLGLNFATLAQHCPRAKKLSSSQSQVQIPGAFFRKDRWPYYTPKRYMQPFAEIFRMIHVSACLPAAALYLRDLEQMDEMLTFLTAFKLLGMDRLAERLEKKVCAILQTDFRLRVRDLRAFWSLFSDPHPIPPDEDGVRRAFNVPGMMESLIQNLRNVTLSVWQQDPDDFHEACHLIQSKQALRAYLGGSGIDLWPYDQPQHPEWQQRPTQPSTSTQIPMSLHLTSAEFGQSASSSQQLSHTQTSLQPYSSLQPRNPPQPQSFGHHESPRSALINHSQQWLAPGMERLSDTNTPSDQQHMTPQIIADQFDGLDPSINLDFFDWAHVLE